MYLDYSDYNDDYDDSQYIVKNDNLDCGKNPNNFEVCNHVGKDNADTFLLC
jgi:hypothetical protein